MVAELGIPGGNDQLLPLLILCILRTNPPHLITHIKYVMRFRDPQQLAQGDVQFCMTTMMSAVSFIFNLTLEHLTLTDADRADPVIMRADAEAEAEAEADAEAEAAAETDVAAERRTSPATPRRPSTASVGVAASAGAAAAMPPPHRRSHLSATTTDSPPPPPPKAPPTAPSAAPPTASPTPPIRDMAKEAYATTSSFLTNLLNEVKELGHSAAEGVEHL
ncbi:hypothetical protein CAUPRSCDRAFT_12867, partial [Caulochytrium protostelioides]